jgi:hypothetical protein
MENFVEWLKINYPEFLNESGFVQALAGIFQNKHHHPENTYKVDEIIIKKQIIPKDFIRAAQPNQEKWDRDFQNLQKPGTMPSKYHTGSQFKDIGFATHKVFFDAPMTMYVVTDEALQRVSPGAGAYASTKNGYIVMPKNYFIELPTASSDGKLTKDGANTLAHELRHTTQKGEAPQERRQDRNLPGSYSDITSPKSKRYYQDPREMGVRLAAIKNLLDRKTFDKINEKSARKLYNRVVYDEHISTLVYYIPVDNDEKRALRFVLNPEEWIKYAVNNMSKTPGSGDAEMINEKGFYEKMQNAAKKIINELKEMNNDVSSIIGYYDSLDPEKKKNYLDELLRFYDQVVKNNPQNNQFAFQKT